MGRKSQELLGYVLSYSGKPGGPYFGMQVKPKRWGAHELEEAQDVCRVTQEDFPAARILRLTPNRKRVVTQELVESAMQMAVTLESAIGAPRKDLRFHGLECGKYLSKLQAACIAYIKLEVEKWVKKPALLSVGGLMSSKPTSNDTYKIVKFTFKGPPKAVRGKRGLSLAEAQAHCQRPDTRGEGWFHGYIKE